MPRVSSRVEEALDCLSKGGIVVAPTDTIYGIMADATDYSAVERLRRIRRRSGKPFIVLVPSISWVRKLGLELEPVAVRLLSFPGVTVVLKKKASLFYWLGRETIAVRYPRRGFVYKLLNRFGKPLVAPSANPEGKPPARTVKEAVKYFGDEVCLYIEGDSPASKASTLVRVSDKVKVLRRGIYCDISLRLLLRRAGLTL